MKDHRIERLARLLVDYSAGLGEGDRVAVIGYPNAMPLMEAIFERALERGALPLMMLDIAIADELLLKKGSEAQIGFVSPAHQLIYESFDSTIRLRSEPNTRTLSNTDSSRQAQRRAALSPVLRTQLERGASGALRWVGTQYPSSQAYAQDAEMSLGEYEDFVFGACHVDDATPDPVEFWRGVQKEQQRLVDHLKGKDRVEVKGPNCDLSLSIRGRTFLNASGQHNMPDGEIFTGPVEDSVNGWVRFSFPAVTQGREVDGVELKFEAGRVVRATAKKNQDFLIKTLDTDPGARFLGEFAIGTNFGIDRHTKNILFDEKIGGTFHMAVGAGYPETGSANKSAVHWDMLCDMQNGGEIWVDGELFYQNGQFRV